MRQKGYLNSLAEHFPHDIYLHARGVRGFRRWLEAKRKKKPLVLELGMGTGDFLVSRAAQDAQLFFLGVETKKDRVVKAHRKASGQKLNNIAFLQAPVDSLMAYRLPQVEKIFLFFPDPWPKERHMKRRLTAPEFLRMYELLLHHHGELVFKTDQQQLFEYTKETLRAEGWNIVEDIRNTQTPLHEQTAYERRFRAEKKPISSTVK